MSHSKLIGLSFGALAFVHVYEGNLGVAIFLFIIGGIAARQT